MMTEQQPVAWVDAANAIAAVVDHHVAPVVEQAVGLAAVVVAAVRILRSRKMHLP
jgi:uncharacterized protein YqgV (UPF0045/DUF77 family)